MTIAQLNEVLIGTLDGVRSKKISARRASAVVQLCAALQRTLPAADLEVRVTRLEEQLAEQSLAAAPDVGPESGLANGSAARDDKPTPDGKLGATPEEQLADGAQAPSKIEQGASSNDGVAAMEDVAIANPSEKLE